ncbi:type III secretion system inner membrane ring lipoprotein SctJ [Chelativorans salis]|uniref:Lipoprotein n=1 Tax=Chelativorans salis TaxID=2978478 RepID=A0ABT2LQL3_9HYPH|nr:type III secretion inner membrane ring lipoprotein SctJ [Chelativorans sp. EGI FJ00035]MCT7376837.1 type III secretion inner membrane ring lipoprotein SctJ [Chelativorans sp. EGI FJ00035]
MSRSVVMVWLGRARLGIVGLGLLLLQACSSELYTGLDQRQANEIVATLMREGIPAQRRPSDDGTMTVTVDKNRFADAMAILDDAGLPKTEFQTLGDVFKRDGLVSSPVEERAAMIYGLSQELSRTISDIDGVLSARVHLVLPDNDPLRRELVPSSASVFIRHRATVAMSDFVPQVKLLVANGISGLAYDNISVVLVPVQGKAADVSEPAFASFLGLWLHPDSVARAKWICFGLLALVLGLAVGLGYEYWRQRRDVYSLPVPVKKT